MEDRMKIVLDGIEKYHLNKYFDKVFTLNPSNMLPYHNFNHIIVMCYHLLKCIELYGVPYNDARLLLIAGLFHDWAHSGGKFDDKENVQIAISGAICAFVFNEDEGNSGDIETIVHIIEATEYPYTIPYDELNQLQAIIRDCDLLMYFEDNWLHQVVLGLKEEMKIDSFQKILLGGIDFISNMKFSLSYGQEIYNAKSEHVINNIKRIIDIIPDNT